MKNRKPVYSLIRPLIPLMFWLFSIPLHLQPKENAAIPRAEVFPLLAHECIELDGRITEAPWHKAASIGPLTMIEPDEGMPASERTEVRVLARTDAIFFGILCYDKSPDRVVSFTMKRDARMRGEDHIKIVLDTFMDGRTGYVFAVNPDGARYDALIEREGGGENEQWDGIWEAAASRFEAGWSVEIYIPVKTLRFGLALSRWGFNVERRIERLQETDRWAAPNRNFRVTSVSRAGQLVSIPAFRQGRGLTIRPYALGSRIRDDADAPASGSFDAGLDVLKNFGSNVTGLLSVNTDFAETEVDTRRVNLTRFPLFFPEKRTFFLEGSDVFEFGLGMASHRDRDIIPFFSRRIGLVKNDDEGENQVVPVTLAVKATGKTGRFNFGVLNSLMQSVEGLTPRTNLFAARGYLRLLEESKVGFLMTAGDPLGRNGSWQAGIDFVYKTSSFQGDKNFLLGLWGLVNNRTDLGKDRTAFGMKLDFPNDLWDVSLTFKRIGADYEPSLGFVPWQGIYKLNFDLIYEPRPDWDWLRLMRHELHTHFVWDLNGLIQQWRIFRTHSRRF